jgi:hypothetical protein
MSLVAPLVARFRVRPTGAGRGHVRGRDFPGSGGGGPGARLSCRGAGDKGRRPARREPPPDDAAGLPTGVYALQVTDPSGKTLLSTDPVECRRVTVDASGRFVSVAPSGACAHATGTDGEDGGISVQLFPYNDTANNGGVYKVWLTSYDA